MVSLNVTSLGYDGPIAETAVTQWLAAAPGTVPSFVGTGWTPSVGPGDRVVQVSTGLAGGFGIADLLNAAADVPLDALASTGTRWDTILVKRDKTPTYVEGVTPGGVTTLEVVAGNVGGSKVPSQYSSDGAVSWTLHSLVGVTGSSGSGSIVEIIDLRAVKSEIHTVSNTQALGGNIWPDGSRALVAGFGEYVKSGQWAAATPLGGFGKENATWAVPSSTDTAFGGVTTSSTKDFYSGTITVPVPPGRTALVTVHAWATAELGPNSAIALYEGDYSGGRERHHCWAGNDSTSNWSNPVTVQATWRIPTTGPVYYRPRVKISGTVRLAKPANKHLVGSDWEWKLL